MVATLKAPVDLLKIEERLEQMVTEAKKANTHLSLINDEQIKEIDIEKE